MICSSEYSTSNYRPRLVFTYEDSPAPPPDDSPDNTLGNQLDSTVTIITVGTISEVSIGIILTYVYKISKTKRK